MSYGQDDKLFTAGRERSVVMKSQCIMAARISIFYWPNLPIYVFVRIANWPLCLVYM